MEPRTGRRVRGTADMKVDVATQAHHPLSDRMRARGLRVAAIVIILLGAGAALLPAGKTISSDMIGGLLIAAGLIETVAGSLRREVRAYAMAAGIVTALAGLLFVLNPETHFFPTVWPIIGWLVIRSVILAVASRGNRQDRSGSGPACRRGWISCLPCC